MTKTSKAIIAVIATLLLLIVVAIIIVATFDWNRLKPTINEKVSAELNRPLPFAAILVWSGSGKSGNRLAKLGARPHVHADDVLLGNPPDIPEITMVHLPRVEATLAPLALLTKTVYLPWIKLQQPDAELIRRSDTLNNWTFNLASDSTKRPIRRPPTGLSASIRSFSIAGASLLTTA